MLLWSFWNLLTFSYSSFASWRAGAVSQWLAPLKKNIHTHHAWVFEIKKSTSAQPKLMCGSPLFFQNLIHDHNLFAHVSMHVARCKQAVFFQTIITFVRKLVFLIGNKKSGQKKIWVNQKKNNDNNFQNVLESGNLRSLFTCPFWLLL